MMGRMTRRPGSWRLRWWRLLLAALAAVLGVLLGAMTASAATPTTAETRVGATSVPTPAVVGSDAGVWGSHHRVDGPLLAGLVVATGVAAKTEAVAGVASRSEVVGELPGLLSSAPKPLGLGSTGRTVPANLQEQIAMTAVRNNPAGRQLSNIVLNDSRWPAGDGWVKMQQIEADVNVHYVYNTVTGAVDDFKFAR